MVVVEDRVLGNSHCVRNRLETRFFSHGELVFGEARRLF